jgi:cyclase
MRTTIRALFAVVTSCALLWMPDVGQAQSTPVPLFTLKQVGANVWAAIDNPAAKGVAAANGGFVIGDDGVAVIDSFASANAAKELLTEIRQRTKLPIKFVINTHYHGDHVGGNGVFADAGASILAHRNVRTWIHAENLRLIGDKAPQSIKTMIQGLTRPSVLYIDGVNLYLGEREIQVRFFPGHTGGDSVVFVPDAGVAFAGDLLWRNMVPNIVDGTTPAWIARWTRWPRPTRSTRSSQATAMWRMHGMSSHSATTSARCARRWATSNAKASPALRSSKRCCPD